MHEVFISLPFRKEFDGVSETIRQAAQQNGLAAYRTDDEYQAVLLAQEIRNRIAECQVLVADVSESNANVYHEVGLAQASGKTLILLTRETPTRTAFNIQGLRMIKYDSSNLQALSNDLVLALVEVSSPNEMLRAMLVPRSLGRPTGDSRFVVATSPLSYRRAIGRSGGYSRLRRTSSDYVGVSGIMQGFGLLYDFDPLPDILDPEDYRNEVLNADMTIYCIASPKANRWTRSLLRELAGRWTPSLEFRPEEKDTNLRNISVSIFHDGNLLHPSGWDFESKGDRYYRDFGLIVRGPNPSNPDRMIAVLAGRSSLGTEAACYAFVTPHHLTKLRDLLRGHRLDIEDHRQAFWALISLRRARGDGLEEAILDSLRVERAEPFRRRNH